MLVPHLEHGLPLRRGFGAEYVSGLRGDGVRGIQDLVDNLRRQRSSHLIDSMSSPPPQGRIYGHSAPPKRLTCNPVLSDSDRTESELIFSWAGFTAILVQRRPLRLHECAPQGLKKGTVRLGVSGWVSGFPGGFPRGFQGFPLGLEGFPPLGHPKKC